MKKTILSAVIAASFVTAAQAADFDKAGVAVEAESKHFGVALGTGANTSFADTARTLNIHTNSLPVTIGATVIEDGEDTAYRLSVSKQFDFAVAKNTSVYVTPEMNVTWGDVAYDCKEHVCFGPYDCADKEVRAGGVAGVKYTFKYATAFAQTGYEFGTTKNLESYKEFTGRDGHTMIGVQIPVSDATLTVAAVTLRDKDFNSTDREAMVKMSFKF
jgi:opacity protein-like surface antigen